MIRKHFRVKRVLIGLAFAAFVAPAAQASVIESGGAPVTPAATQVTSEHSIQTPTLTQLQVEGMRLQAMADAYRQPSVVRSERSYGAPGPDPSYAPLVVSSTSSSSFNWQDAGIGATIAFGITLLLLTAVALGRRSRSGLGQTGLTSA